MNPFIEQPELWSEFHSRMIVAIADALDELISRDYRVAVEKRIYLGQSEEQRLVRHSRCRHYNVSRSTIELPQLETVQERYLEIRAGATGSVITKRSNGWRKVWGRGSGFDRRFDRPSVPHLLPLIGRLEDEFFPESTAMSDQPQTGAEAVDAAIAQGLDLDGSPIPADQLDLYRSVMALEGDRQRSGVTNSMRSRIVRIGAKHIPQAELNQKLVDAGWAGLKEKEIAFYYGGK